MTASATSRIACFVSHFKVIPIEHKQFQKVRHTLRKNINTLAMLTHDVLLRHFRKGIGSCTLLSLM